MMRKICTVIQSLLSRLPDHYSSYSSDCEKHPKLLTLIWRVNIVHDITKVEQHKLLGTDMGHSLTTCSSRRHAKPFPLNHCHSKTIRHVCQICSESPVVEGQCIPGKPPSERELVVQEARAWCPILLRVNLSQQPTKPLHQRIRSRTHL